MVTTKEILLSTTLEDEEHCFTTHAKVKIDMSDPTLRYHVSLGDASKWLTKVQFNQLLRLLSGARREEKKEVTNGTAL